MSMGLFACNYNRLKMFGSLLAIKPFILMTFYKSQTEPSVILFGRLKIRWRLLFLCALVSSLLSLFSVKTSVKLFLKDFWSVYIPFALLLEILQSTANGVVDQSSNDAIAVNPLLEQGTAGACLASGIESSKHPYVTERACWELSRLFAEENLACASSIYDEIVRSQEPGHPAAASSRLICQAATEMLGRFKVQLEERAKILRSLDSGTFSLNSLFLF